MLLKEIKAQKILNSRKEPTIEVIINNQKSSAPSGKSKGKAETPSYHNSFQWNINFLNKFKPNLQINSFQDLKKLESLIKQKLKFSRPQQFGANALFALESAVLKSLAKEKNLELWQLINPNAKFLPVPVGNAVGGGLHSCNKNKPTFQEFLLIPNKKTFKENYQITESIHKQLKCLTNAKKKNDEGAWQTYLNNEQVLNLLAKFKNIQIGLDIAASSFFVNSKYQYHSGSLSKQQQISYINSLIKKYNLFYIEDPLEENDFDGFSKIKHSSNNLIVGDDLTATQIPRLEKAINKNSINAMIIKPNQNGSLIELQEIFQICRKNKIKTILSHRSGETLDNALADLAVGFGADFIKCGIATKWREVKLKRLVEIEKSLEK